MGKLQHACKVVKPGRTFLRGIFEVLWGVAKRHHHVRLNHAFCSDLMWWHTFLDVWNGKAMMWVQDQWSPELEVFTDASGEVGCGALWGTQWLQLKWANTATWKDTPITQKEVYQQFWGVLYGGTSGGLNVCYYTVTTRQQWLS